MVRAVHKRGREPLMLDTEKHLKAVAILFGFLLASCASRDPDIRKVIGSSPKFIGQKHVELKRLFSINVTEIGMFNKQMSNDYESSIDFDENGHMYILDSFENSISVFDQNGKLARKFGKSGQGPTEFQGASRILIQEEKMFVFQWLQGLSYKIVNLEGEYISQQNIFFENPLKIKRVGDHFIVFSGKTGPTFSKLEFIITIVDDSFSKLKEIFHHEYPPGLRGPHYNFNWPYWLLILKSGEFYFPEDNFGTYSIIKYDKDGRPKLIFGRTYHKRNYSKEAKERFHSLYAKEIERGEIAFPPSPPVIRNMFQDSRNHIWVISGETGDDNGIPDYENTLDIFSDNGEWLYSLKTNLISSHCFYDDGKIYSVSPIDPSSYEQFIDVCQIALVKDQ
jgi:hypothetical protein